MNPKYVIVDVPVSEYIKELKRQKIIEVVIRGGDAIIGRYGTNKSTLRRLIKQHQEAK